MSQKVVQVVRTRRNRQFDLMRILFATFVILSHSFEFIDGNRSRELFTRLTGAMSFGEVGVEGFFLLSGFLILQSWLHDPELLNFLRKRALRLYPGYIVSCLLGTLVLGWLLPGVPHYFHHITYHFPLSLTILGLPNVPRMASGSNEVLQNGSLWTIQYEFRCYLLVALLGVTGALHKRWIWGATTVLCFLIYSCPGINSHLIWHHYKAVTGDPYQVFRLVSAFLIGGCFFLFADRIPFRPALAVGAIALLVIARFAFTDHFHALFMVTGGYLLFYLGHIDIPALDRMGRFPDISYGVYLYGWPVEVLWLALVGGSPWTTFAGVTTICYVLGWLSWHFVERPMLKLKRRSTAPLPAP